MGDKREGCSVEPGALTAGGQLTIDYLVEELRVQRAANHNLLAQADDAKRLAASRTRELELCTMKRDVAQGNLRVAVRETTIAREGRATMATQLGAAQGYIKKLREELSASVAYGNAAGKEAGRAVQRLKEAEARVARLQGDSLELAALRIRLERVEAELELCREASDRRVRAAANS